MNMNFIHIPLIITRVIGKIFSLEPGREVLRKYPKAINTLPLEGRNSQNFLPSRAHRIVERVLFPQLGMKSVSSLPETRYLGIKTQLLGVYLDNGCQYQLQTAQ